MPDKDSTDLNERDLELIAREYGKPLPEKLKQNVLEKIQQKRRESDLEQHFNELEKDRESPELEA